MQSNISKFTITTDTNQTEYTQCESYKITNYHDNLLNKISFHKADKANLNDKPITNAQTINSLISIEDQFNFLTIGYNMKTKVSTNLTTLQMNPKIIENKTCFVQDALDPKKIKTICNFQDTPFNITGIFDYDYSFPENTSYFLLVVNYTILILVDANKEEFISDVSIRNFIEKNKADPRLKSVKYEFDANPQNVCNYSCLINQDENKNPKIIWKFSEKIITLKFRPRKIDPNSNQIKLGNYLNSKQSMQSASSSSTPQNSSFIAISFHLGKLKLFHFESKALISEFKSSFGNIITIDYSADGKLLGVGTESDEVFIIEADTNSFLYCLEGHKNYVSSIIFDEQLQDDEDQLEALEEQKQLLLNSSHMETIAADYNSIPIGNNSSNNINNYLRQSTSGNAVGSLGFASTSHYKNPSRQINPLELFENLKEEQELGNSQNFQARVFDPKSFKRMRSVMAHQTCSSNSNVLNNQSQTSTTNFNYNGNSSNSINNNVYNNNNNNNNNECKIYDVYTAGYDGYLGVWRIEYYYDLEPISGLAKQLAELSLNPKDSNIIKKVASPKPTLLANQSEKNVYYTDFVRIQNVPIFTLKMIDNMLVLIGKRNSTGSSVFVKFFHGLILSEEPLTKKNVNLSNTEKVISEEAYANNTSNNYNNAVNGRKRGSNNVDSKYQELKQSGANAKGNNGNEKNPNNSSVNTNANSVLSSSSNNNEGRERGVKDSKENSNNNLNVKNNNNRRGNSRIKEPVGNSSSSGNGNVQSRNFNKSPYKEK